MPLKRLVSGSDDVLTQDTDFSRDVSGRYVCNTVTEAVASTDPNPRPDVGRNNARFDARPFDIIVIGGGTFGAALAEHLFFRGFGRSHRILVLEAGSFTIPEHVQNLPALGLGVADATSIQDLRAAGNFGLDKPQKEVWGLPWHSPQKFPGLAYCIGGRSVYWGGWSPELLTSELPSAWPADVVNELRATELVDGSAGYFSQASGQIGVTETNDFIFGELHRALRAQLRDGLAAVTDAMPLGSLPDHPGVRFSQSPPTAAELLVMLGEPPTTTPPPVQQLKDELKLEAPLAVQGQSGHAGFFPFNKFSAVPLLMKATREADSESKTDDVRKRLMVIPRCRVNELKTAPDGGKLRVTEVVTERGSIFVPPNGVVIIALGTIESTRLAQHSFQSLPPAAFDRIGKNLMAHLRSNLDFRVPREALKFLPATAKGLQASALFVKGQHAFSDGSGVGHFHLQITATGGAAGLANSEAELFKKIPDIDKFEQHLHSSDTHVVITVRGIGEMQPLNAQSFVRPDPETEFGVKRAFVSIQPSARDMELWEAMDKAADDAARIFANGKKIDLIVKQNVKKTNVDPAALATELPHVIDDPTSPGKKINNPERRDGLGTTHHEAGTLRMGDNPNQSVTDANCRFHEVVNAYAIGPALFPTIGSPNPMLTGIALARRLGDHLLPPTPAAKPDPGFKYLFDGTGAQFKNWKMASGGGGNFIIVNRALVAQPFGEIGLLYYTAEKFENFTLRLEFLLSRPVGRDNDNSGVFVRFRDPSQPVPRADGSGISDIYNNQAFVAVDTGFEIQIDEEARGDTRFGEVDGLLFNRTGAIYKVKDFGTADGQQNYQNNQRLAQERWHSYEIAVSGNTYVVRLNGQEATRFTRKASDVFRGNPPSVDPVSGFIGLQTHTGQVSFANVRIRID
jgi:choline dehydrogenase-like flavoprotein